MQCSNAVPKPWGSSGSGKNKLAIKIHLEREIEKFEYGMNVR